MNDFLFFICQQGETDSLYHYHYTQTENKEKTVFRPLTHSFLQGGFRPPSWLF